jgi:NlpE N-terminal domain
MLMKPLINLFLITAIFVMITACTSAITPGSTANPATVGAPTASPQAAGSSILGVYEAITPCGSQVRPLPQITSTTNCEQIIWKLSLFQDAATSEPTTYLLDSVYGMPQQGTMGLIGGGTSITMAGSWEIVTGTKLDPNAVVYQLNVDTPETTISFLKLNESMLHVLAHDKTLMVGNASWSYTLNRTDNRNPLPTTEPSDLGAAVPTRPPLPPIPPGSSVFATYEGRAPCNTVLFELLDIASFLDCNKVKWRLTLYQDQNTGTPGSYLCFGTRTFREGTWTIISGLPRDPDAVVYQLKLAGAQPPVSLLMVDENHLFLLDKEMNLLVGNAQLSYTVSRIDPGVE